MVAVDSDHAQLPRFGNSNKAPACLKYMEELSSLIDGLFSQEQKDLDLLEQEVTADVHLFYDSSTEAHKSSIKVWSETPTLRDLLQNGPAQCLRRRLPTLKDPINRQKDFSDIQQPARTQNPPVPMIVVTSDEDLHVDLQTAQSMPSSTEEEITGRYAQSSTPSYSYHSIKAYVGQSVDVADTNGFTKPEDTLEDSTKFTQWYADEEKGKEAALF